MKLRERETGRQGLMRSQAEVIFRRRCNSIYRGMKGRADKEHMPCIDRGDFCFWLLNHFTLNPAGTVRCFYSGDILTAENFFVDHRTPLSRGGYQP